MTATWEYQIVEEPNPTALQERLTRMLRVLIVTLIASSGCARPAPSVPLPAPNPNGCYVMVFEQPEFSGSGDVLNGPGKWASLDGLRQTNHDGWRNRIRSLRTGHIATVTVYTDEGFNGESRRFGPDTSRAQVDASLSARIESLELTCG